MIVTIHVGMPKSGSSFIQNSLLERNLYVSQNIHNEFVASFDDFLEIIYNIKLDRNVLISNESFCGMMNTPLNMSGKDFFNIFIEHCLKSPHEIRLIFILRNMNDFIYSYYLDFFKKNKTDKNFIQFTNSINLSDISISDRLEVASSIKCLYLDFEMLKKNPSDIKIKINNFTGLNLQFKKNINRKVNESPQNYVSLYAHRFFCRISLKVELLYNRINLLFPTIKLNVPFLATKPRRDFLVKYTKFFNIGLFLIKRKKIDSNIQVFLDNENAKIKSVLSKNEC